MESSETNHIGNNQWNQWKQETIDTATAPEPGNSLVNFRKFTSEFAEIH